MRKPIDNVNHKAKAAASAAAPSPAPAAAPAAATPALPAPSEDEVLELVHGVMHAYRSLQYRALRDGPHEITHMDGKVLGHFGRHPGSTLSDLAQHSGRDKAQLARLVKGLRDAGLLDGEVDPADRRNTRLTLTVAGQVVQRSLRQQARRVGAKALAGLSAAEQAQLAALLRRVRANLEPAG